MPEKDVTLWNFLMVGIMGLWGAILSIADKIRSGKVKQIDIITFAGEIATNLFVTYTVFFISLGLGFHPYYAVGVGGLAGHFGVRSFFLFRKWMVTK